MEPIPVVLHLGPLSVHTYGLGLAITFYVAFRLLERRLGRAGRPTEWVATMAIVVVASAILGARAMHVAANWSDYGAHPSEIPIIWHGGLSSFGGLLLAVPVGLAFAKRHCGDLGLMGALDLATPVLMGCWALGRLLGPQLMVAGGGHPSTAWFAMAYAGQVGRRVPVPIIQALEDGLSAFVLIRLERRLGRVTVQPGRSTRPTGVVTGVSMVLWGISRGLDEHFLLDGGSNLGSLLVEWASIALVVGGAVVLLRAAHRWRTATDGAALTMPS